MPEGPPQRAAGHRRGDPCQVEDLGHHQEHHEAAVGVDGDVANRWNRDGGGCQGRTGRGQFAYQALLASFSAAAIVVGGYWLMS